MNLSDLSTLISLLIGLSGFIAGGILWYKGSVEKRYAAERDFQHLRRNQEQITQVIKLNSEEIEEIKHIENALLEEVRKLSKYSDDISKVVLEQKIFINAMHHRLEIISSKIDGSTSGWKKPD